MLKLLLTAILCFTIVTVIEGQCPQPPILRPCACTSSGVETYLTCAHLKGQTDLHRVFHSAFNHSFDHLEITRSKLVSIPARSLQTKRFATMRIARSSMLSLFSRGPGADNDLRSVTLEDVTFEDGIDWSQFENLRQVDRIAIKDVVVPELDASFREKVSRVLRSFVLKRTNDLFFGKTLQFSKMVFSSMPDLVDVRILENEIRELKRSMFAVTNTIETLLFNDNEIGSLPEDMFKNMPQLLRIGLRNNNIICITSHHGQAYKNLIALILEGNPINCDCTIKWLASRDHHSKYVTSSCAQPSHLLGKEITDLTVAHFLHCA